MSKAGVNGAGNWFHVEMCVLGLAKYSGFVDVAEVGRGDSAGR